ncbi:radial spoke head protein 9 [Cystoisospora suis]|uniref:Radial spoke head protein 9 homolog n=1 Tax=Cystoisospora suis TaxID=483139 RepID=A0A2C6L9A0_9APIC|nr:radial spoke head protein 9 [Cystoisospora suis]
MEVRSLEFGLENVASLGMTLSPYEKMALGVGLVKLRKKEQIQGEIFFWGKLLGQESDYYLSYVIREDISESYPLKKFFYSTTASDFRELPVLTDEQHQALASCGSPFLTGTPERVLDLKRDSARTPPEGGEANEDEEVPSEDSPVQISQELREMHALSYLVGKIDSATAVVPRGAFRLRHHNHVAPAPEFEGKQQGAACGFGFARSQRLSSWVHFRPAENLEALRSVVSKDYQLRRSLDTSRLFAGLAPEAWDRGHPSVSCSSTVTRSRLSPSLFDVQFHADFLETLESDVPRGRRLQDIRRAGCWLIRYDASSCAVTLRSLLWPGYIAYHILNTKFFGSVYIGNGEPNGDLPFLLP